MSNSQQLAKILTDKGWQVRVWWEPVTDNLWGSDGGYCLDIQNPDTETLKGFHCHWLGYNYETALAASHSYPEKVMKPTTRDTALTIRSIVTHALICRPEVSPQEVDLIVDQCTDLVSAAQVPYTTMEAGHLNVMTAHLKLLTLIKDMRDTQVAYFASRKGTRFGDRKILSRSKQLEGDLDRLVAEQLASAETYLSIDTPPSDVNP